MADDLDAFIAERTKKNPRFPEMLKDAMKRRMTVCFFCNDTHQMPLGEQMVMCTHCPLPCNTCRAGGTGPYCESTPCPCKCHRKARKMSIEADFTTVTNSLDRHDRPAHEALRRIRAALKGGELDKDAAVDDATHAAAEALEKHGIKVDLDALNDQISQAIKD